MNRDPQARIDRILEAAVVEFSETGKQGARVDAIARRAKMNKRLLYHYVGDKDALFKATLGACLDRIGGTGGEPDRQSWQILCRAAAEDLRPELAVLAEKLRRADTSAELAIIRAGLTVLDSLLPELVEALAADLALESGRTLLDRIRLVDEEHRDLVDEEHRDPGSKPRVRMQPELRGLED